MLSAYAHLVRAHRDSDLSAPPYRGEHRGSAGQHLRDYLIQLISDATTSGDIRTDCEPGLLADYCESALAASATMPSDAATDKLVEVTLSGLRPPPGQA